MPSLASLSRADGGVITSKTTQRHLSYGVAAVALVAFPSAGGDVRGTSSCNSLHETALMQLPTKAPQPPRAGCGRDAHCAASSAHLSDAVPLHHAAAPASTLGVPPAARHAPYSPMQSLAPPLCTHTACPLEQHHDAPPLHVHAPPPAGHV